MLSQTVIYAIRALAFLAKHGEGKPIQSKTIAEEMQIPQNFLSKIMHRMVQEGFVHSVRGINGGFTLAKMPAKIRLVDIAGCLMDLSSYRHCFLGLNNCDGSCQVHTRWNPVHEALDQFLEQTTIDMVM